MPSLARVLDSAAYGDEAVVWSRPSFPHVLTTASDRPLQLGTLGLVFLPLVPLGLHIFDGLGSPSYLKTWI
jgi:hypothetical protein